MPKLRSPYGDCMVDLETYGRGPGCPVLSIGAVMFGPGSVGDGKAFGHYAVVSLKDCVEQGLEVDPETVEWWARQSPQARAVIDEAERSKLRLHDALLDFGRFLHRHSSAGAVKVWGNGASFDNAILAHCYARLGLPLPWRFWNDRCHRTLRSLVPAVPEPERSSTHHNALDDAVHQARHAAAILAARDASGGDQA